MASHRMPVCSVVVGAPRGPAFWACPSCQLRIGRGGVYTSYNAIVATCPPPLVVSAPIDENTAQLCRFSPFAPVGEADFRRLSSENVMLFSLVDCARWLRPYDPENVPVRTRLMGP